MRKWYVYIVQRDSGGVTIGRCSDVQGRLQQLETMLGETLRVLLTFRETPELNARSVQARFQHLRMIGEWFRFDPDLATWLRDTAITVGDRSPRNGRCTCRNGESCRRCQRICESCAGHGCQSCEYTGLAGTRPPTLPPAVPADVFRQPESPVGPIGSLGTPSEPQTNDLLRPEAIVVAAPQVMTQTPKEAPPVATRYLARYTARTTRKTLRQGLRQVGSILLDQPVSDPNHVPWPKVTYLHLLYVKRRLVDAKYSSAAVNLCINAVRGVMAQCFRDGLITHDDLIKIQDIKQVRRDDTSAGRALSNLERHAMFSACADTAIGRRHLAILCLCMGAGLRRIEAIAVQRDHYSAEGVVDVKHGKGDKRRLVPLGKRERELLATWLALRGDSPGPILCRIIDGKIDPTRPMSYDSVQTELDTLAKLAKIDPITPHDLRRTYITRLLSRNADVLTVARLAGHESLETTKKYDRRPEDAKRDAAELFELTPEELAKIDAGGVSDGDDTRAPT